MTTVKELTQIGSRLKEYVSVKNIKIVELGEISNNSGTQIYNILKGKKYGVDKFINVVRQLPDLNVYWLLFGEGSMHRGQPAAGAVVTPDTEEVLKTEIGNLKAMLAYQEMTIGAYKRALDIAGSSTEDLKKMLEFYKKEYEALSKKEKKSA